MKIQECGNYDKDAMCARSGQRKHPRRDVFGYDGTALSDGHCYDATDERVKELDVSPFTKQPFSESDLVSKSQ